MLQLRTITWAALACARPRDQRRIKTGRYSRHSISSGLDYPGAAGALPLAEIGWQPRRHQDASALNAFRLTEEEHHPALFSHAVAWVLDHAEELPQGGDVLVNLSGRGDKDLGIVKKYLNL
ncbi:MAG: hypothetical protein ACLT8E_06520 [Akkermansia sp.]